MPMKWRVRRAEAFLDLHHNLTAMDQLVAQMQSTSDYLTQQLASLQAKTSK